MITIRCFFLTFFVSATSLFGSAQSDAVGPKNSPDAIVAADGSGQYKTVQEAINAAPQTTSLAKPWIIGVKSGVYPEVVYIQREKRFVHLVGEGAATTKITAALAAKTIGADGKPLGTFRTATVQIDADDFTFEKITLENAAGPVGQALAVRIDGDRVTFRDCRFLGWQDTILANRGRHYFKRCFISGATDFIFGGATAYFDECEIRCDGDGYITAASTPREQAYGFVFSHCVISGSKPALRTYLGRPWRDFGMTAFLNTEMSDVVRTEGWHNWGKPEREKTARYSEFGCTGAGALSDKRVSWAHPLSGKEAASLTPEIVLGGSDGWLPDATH